MHYYQLSYEIKPLLRSKGGRQKGVTIYSTPPSKRKTADIWSNYQPLFLKKFQTERCITNLDTVFLTIFKMDSARCAWYSRSWHEWPTKKFIHKGALSTICLSNNKKSRFLGRINDCRLCLSLSVIISVFKLIGNFSFMLSINCHVWIEHSSKKEMREVKSLNCSSNDGAGNSSVSVSSLPEIPGFTMVKMLLSINYLGQLKEKGKL